MCCPTFTSKSSWYHGRFGLGSCHIHCYSRLQYACPMAGISVAGSDPVTCAYHQVDFYQHDTNGKLQDVTEGKIVSVEYLTLVGGQMTYGTHCSAGRRRSHTLRHAQKNLNKRFF